jgi:hypothetical protein
VRGDLAECGAGGWRALREVSGLVARRQAALLDGLAAVDRVIAIVLPIGLMLSHASRWWADAYAVDIQMLQYDSAICRDSCNRVAHAISSCLCRAAQRRAESLAGWSWASGYVLALAIAARVGSTVALFALVLFLGTLGTTTIVRARCRAFAEHFFAVVFPRLIRVGLVSAAGDLGRAHVHGVHRCPG